MNILTSIENQTRRLGISSHEVAIVRDRLHTDVLMAARAGEFGILTLTGETQRSHLAASKIQPDPVIENFAELGELLAAAKRRDKTQKIQIG